MRIDILTIFPEMFEPALAVSIPGRARDAGLLSWHTTDIRGFATDKHSKVDDRPFGGGPGMVMYCQPMWDAHEHALAQDPRPARTLLTSPQGVPLTQPLVEELAREERLVVIAGHYEGLDERVIERIAPLEVSVGDYVLSGGELPAMLLIDAVARLQPGALAGMLTALSRTVSRSLQVMVGGSWTARTTPARGSGRGRRSLRSSFLETTPGSQPGVSTSDFSGPRPAGLTSLWIKKIPRIPPDEALGPAYHAGHSP